MTKVIGNWWNSEEVRNSRRALVLIIAFFGLVLFYKHGRDNISPTDAYSLNIHTEVFGVALGVIITVFVIDVLNRRRDAERRQQDLIDRLLREVKSPDHGTAIDALDQLRENGWLCGENGLLKGLDLQGVKWMKAKLNKANLKETNLQGACLKGANLQFANMEGTMLWFADLSHAYLEHTDLERAELMATKLLGTNLRNANLRNAEVILCQLDKDTRLPDGSQANTDEWFPPFTKPDHPNYWRSDKPYSPAFYLRR